MFVVFSEDSGQQFQKGGALKQREAQDLQDRVQRQLDLQPFPQEGNEHVGANCNPDLRLHGIDAVAHEGFDAQVLWAAPDFPDTLNGNMCSGDRNGFKEALHGRIQA